jgi:hypothetical protein
MPKGLGHGHTDFSGDLREVQDWNIASLTKFDFCLDAAALAVDPVSRLLAVGAPNHSY